VAGKRGRQTQYGIRFNGVVEADTVKEGARLHSKMGSGTRLGFGLLRGLRSDGLIDLKESHLQLAEKVEEQRVFLGG
jgi:hypothetical protein